MRSRLLLLTAVAAGVGAAPAQASCAQAPGLPVLAEHDSVFTGDVTGLDLRGGIAEVRVRDVWHGPDLPPEVVVVGGQLERGASSSADRTYTRGTRYVFFVQRDEDGVLRDNACTPTAQEGAYPQLDPPGVRGPEPGAPPPADPRETPWPVWAASAGAVAAAGALLQRRRSRRQG